VPLAQDGQLKPGMSAAVTIDTVEKQDALLIPRDAVTTDQTGKQGVYTVDNGPNGQIAVFKTPSFGVSDNSNIEVTSGLNPGDLVIVSGQSSLTNNQRVRVAGDNSGGGQGGQGGRNAAASGKPQAPGKPQASASGKPQASAQSS